MKRMQARWRIALGQVALLVSVLMLAVAIGLVPTPREGLIEGRARVCETIAVGSSILATRNDTAGLKAMLQAVASRNPDVLSAAVRSDDGKLIALAGDAAHDAEWKLHGASAIDSYVYVPIWANDKHWGNVEVRFKPLGGTGFLSYILHPAVLLIAFVASITYLLYLGYLKKTLQHLDPSKVVPGRVRSALDTLAEGLLVLDNEERIVLANNSLSTIIGRSSEELVGTRVSQIKWELDTAASEDATMPWTRAIRESSPQQNITVRLRDAIGSTRTFVANCSPVLGQDGKYRGVLVSLEDVTQLEAQKVELRKSKEAAESANRAKSEFLARMSHEIRTPMNAIIGFADVLRRGFEESPAERMEYLETIHSSGQHLLELINDILDLSKIEAGRLQVELASCSPHEIAAEVVTILGVKARQKHIALEYDWSGPVPEKIVSDPTRLRQVLTNIIGNAIKFTERGGVRLVIRTIQGVDSKLAFDIIDTGIGIGDEAIGRLFQPFSQADTSITRRFGGTGLGLAISRQLAQALGGDITITSVPGRGSTFTVTVATGPLAGVTLLQEPPRQPLHNRAIEQGAIDLPPLRVLSVEDGESNQKLIALVLRRSGVAVVDQALNGQVGIDMATRGNYDVILMDMQMPVMDGYTAAATLRQRGITIPIIALTAHAMKGEEDKTRAAGCTGYVPKPIDVDLLLRTVALQTGHTITPRSSESLRPARLASASLTSSGATDAPICSTLPSDDSDFREIIDEFVQRLHQQLGEMQSAFEQRELSRVASLAHWLKGSGGSAGFDAFTNPARQLEESAKAGRLEAIEASINELKELTSRVYVPAQPASLKVEQKI